MIGSLVIKNILILLLIAFIFLAFNYWGKSKYSYLNSSEFGQRAKLFGISAVFTMLTLFSIFVYNFSKDRVPHYKNVLVDYRKTYFDELSQAFVTNAEASVVMKSVSQKNRQDKQIDLLQEINSKLEYIKKTPTPPVFNTNSFNKKMDELLEKQKNISKENKSAIELLSRGHVHSFDELIKEFEEIVTSSLTNQTVGLVVSNRGLLDNHARIFKQELSNSSMGVNSESILVNRQVALGNHVKQLDSEVEKLEQRHNDHLSIQGNHDSFNPGYKYENIETDRPIEFDVGFPRERISTQGVVCSCANEEPCLQKIHNTAALNAIEDQIDETVVSVFVVGHHDYRDDPTSNYQLARRRAECVIKHLKSVNSEIQYQAISGTNQFELDDNATAEELRSDRKAVVYLVKRSEP